MVGKDPLRNLEGESTPCKIWERIGCVWPVRVHQPCSLCGVTRHRVVVNDPDQDSSVKSLRDALAICSATIHCQNQLNAILLRREERPLWDAVTVAVSIWDVALRDRTDRA
jgi:hypothetical protein